MFSDTHTHFTGSPLYPEFGGSPLKSEEVQGVLKQARDHGVALMVAASHDLSSAERVTRVASEEDGVYAAIGLHPWIATPIDDETYKSYLALAGRPKVAAISEIGLDNVRARAGREDQLQALTRMLSLARETGLPVILHDRGCHKEIMEVLREGTPPAGAIHGFEGNVAELKDWLDLGYYVSIGRPVLGPDGESLREMVEQIPEERLLLETDSPNLSSEGVLEGQARVLQVAQVVATWRGGTTAQELGDVTTENLQRMLGI